MRETESRTIMPVWRCSSRVIGTPMSALDTRRSVAVGGGSEISNISMGSKIRRQSISRPSPSAVMGRRWICYVALLLFCVWIVELLTDLLWEVKYCREVLRQSCILVILSATPACPSVTGQLLPYNQLTFLSLRLFPQFISLVHPGHPDNNTPNDYFLCNLWEYYRIHSHSYCRVRACITISTPPPTPYSVVHTGMRYCLCGSGV